MGVVTETSDSNPTFDSSTTPENHDTTTISAVRRHSPLFRVLAWMGIAAGSLFIVATVFFSGFVIGQHSGGGGHHGRHAMLIPHPPMGRGGPDGPMMRPGGPMGPDAGPGGERLTPPSQQPKP
jgi:hypothetical protein